MVGKAVASCCFQASALCRPQGQLARPSLQMHLQISVTPAVCHESAGRLAENCMRQVVRSPAFIMT